MQMTATSSSSTEWASPAPSDGRGVRPERRTGRDRREHPRTPVFAPVRLRLAGGPPPGKLMAAHLVDVSITGVGIRMTRPMAPGTEFTLEVDSPVVKAFRYRVVRCVQVDGDDFHVGAAFVRTTTRRTAGTGTTTTSNS
jgi:hypothetical protein